MDSWIPFIYYVIIYYRHYSFWYLNRNLVNGNPSGWLLYLSDVSPSILNIPYYQAHLVSFLPQAFFHRALVPFSGRWYLETKILVLGVFTPYKDVAASRTCSPIRAYVRVYSVHLCVHVSVCLLLCNFILVLVPVRHHGILFSFPVSYLYFPFLTVENSGFQHQ